MFVETVNFISDIYKIYDQLNIKILIDWNVLALFLGFFYTFVASLKFFVFLLVLVFGIFIKYGYAW